MQYDDVITNSRWRTDAVLQNRFLAIISALYCPINAKFGKEMKDHMPKNVT